MNKYFLLGGKNIPKVPSAFASEQVPLAHQLIAELDGADELPFQMELVKISMEKNGISKSLDLTDLTTIWLDYQPNDLAWPLMSEQMKLIVDQHLTGNEGTDWIAAKINHTTTQKTYYIPRFSKMLDTLEEAKTTYMKPCFSLTKIAQYSIFHKPAPGNLWKITSALYIREEMKALFKKDNLTGIEFEETWVA